MVDPIGRISHPLHSQKAGHDVPALAKHMKEQVLTMAEQLQKLMDDPSLASHAPFLDKFVKNASKLNETIDESITLR